MSRFERLSVLDELFLATLARFPAAQERALLLDDLKPKEISKRKRAMASIDPGMGRHSAGDLMWSSLS